MRSAVSDKFTRPLQLSLPILISYIYNMLNPRVTHSSDDTTNESVSSNTAAGPMSNSLLCLSLLPYKVSILHCEYLSCLNIYHKAHALHVHIEIPGYNMSLLDSFIAMQLLISASLPHTIPPGNYMLQSSLCQRSCLFLIMNGGTCLVFPWLI